MKKNKFLNFIFSLFPGAAHMYCDQQKKGVLFMSLFVTLLFLSATFTGVFVLGFSVVLWFYAIFDAMSLPDMLFEQRKVADNYFMSQLKKVLKSVHLENKSVSRILGIGLIAAGAYLIISNVVTPILCYYFNYWLMYDIFHSYLPATVFGLVIIFFGIYLIFGGKKPNDATTDPFSNKEE